ncbi:MAG: hypothetical protein IJN16_08705 [Lachnospiraceae bacterium]|nr:hypothetical protein [Lachnospiraceae bacterium]
MRNGKFAIYLGREFTSGKSKEGKIILRSTNIGDVEYGFEPCEPFFYRNCKNAVVCLKYVNRSEVEDYFSLRTKATYAGFEFEVVEEKGDQISIITMTGDYREWLKMGMKCIDKGVYQKWINKDEAVIEVIKEQL